MGRPKKEKDPWADLDQDFKSAIEGGDEAMIRAKISEVAIVNAQLMDAKDQDLDLAEKSEIFKEAGAVYREGAKQNKLKIKYAKKMLESQGKL